MKKYNKNIYKSAKEEKHWKAIYPMGVLEYEVLKYVKKIKSFTPGEIMVFLNTKGNYKEYIKPTATEVKRFLKYNTKGLRIGYAHVVRAIDALYVHGYIDQTAFYWEKGDIKYIGK